MAGAAPQTRGGSNAGTITMVASIVVSVLLLGVLIWLITQQEQLRTTAEQAKTAKERLVRGNEETSAKTLFPDASAAGKTIVGEMLKGVQLLCGRISGNQNDSPQAAQGKLDAALSRIASENKVPHPNQFTGAYGAATIIENLYQAYVDELAAREKADADRDQANAAMEAARKSQDELQKRFGDDLAKLRAKVDELQTAKSDFERLKSTEIESLSSQIGAKQDALSAARLEGSKRTQKLGQELRARDQLLDEQREALQTLRGPGAEASQELAVARNPVGKVLRALPGDSLVHIDLGKEDHVTLGMTFSVYSANTRVPLDGRGKASIDAVSIGRRTSECRVIVAPPPQDPILEGDAVGNIVLSRDRRKQQRFCIVGQFDTDFDGQPDARGDEAIRALVERFGGAVVDTVDAMTDYVIVGVEPPADGAAHGMELAPPPMKPAAARPAAQAPAKKAEAEPDEGGGEEAKGGEKESGGEEPKAEGEEAGGEKEGATEEGGDEEAGAAKKAAAKPAPTKTAPAKVEAPEATDAKEEPAAEEEPTAATPSKSSAEVDPTAATRLRRARTDRDRYDEAVLRARMFSIPRLNEDRFFNFIGLEKGPIAAKRLEK